MIKQSKIGVAMGNPTIWVNTKFDADKKVYNDHMTERHRKFMFNIRDDEKSISKEH